jgi:ribosomal protein L11 methyltransferase
MRETYQELTIRLDEQFVELMADFVANIFEDTLEIGQKSIILRSENDLLHIKDSIENFVDTIGGDFNMEFIFKEMQNIDWIENYKNSVEPIGISQFYIHPSWHKPEKDKINIKIDPALALGLGIMRQHTAV